MIKHGVIVKLRNQDEYQIIVFENGELALLNFGNVNKKNLITLKHYDGLRHKTSASLDICQIMSAERKIIFEDYGK